MMEQSVFEKVRELFRPKENRAGVCANCLSTKTQIVSSPKGGPLYCKCVECEHRWKQAKV